MVSGTVLKILHSRRALQHLLKMAFTKLFHNDYNP